MLIKTHSKNIEHIQTIKTKITKGFFGKETSEIIKESVSLIVLSQKELEKAQIFITSFFHNRFHIHIEINELFKYELQVIDIDCCPAKIMMALNDFKCNNVDNFDKLYEKY